MSSNIKNHDLKVIEPFFTDIVKNGKRCEVRIDDRNYQPKDTITLNQYDPETQQYSGKKVMGVITYVLRDYPAIKKGYCVFSFETEDEISNLFAIQDYLLERGSNDETINERIRELQNLKS